MPEDNAEIFKAFFSGEVFACPTESVWGLSGNPEDHRALQKVLHLKGRDVSKGLILLAGDWAQLEGFCVVDGAMQEKMQRLSLERATSFIVPAGARASALLRGAHDEVAVRVSTHSVVRALCALLKGPIFSTSANLSGQAVCQSMAEVGRVFPDVAVVSGELGGEARPSRLLDWGRGLWLRD